MDRHLLKTPYNALSPRLNLDLLNKITSGPSRKQLAEEIFRDALSVYDREYRLNYHENMLSDTPVVAKAVKYITAKHSKVGLQESTIKVIFENKRPLPGKISLRPDLHRSIDKTLYDFIVFRFDELTVQTAVGVKTKGCTVPTIFKEIKETKDTHILHFEIVTVLGKEGRLQNHLHLPKLKINLDMELCQFISDELIRRAMDDSVQGHIVFGTLEERLKSKLSDLMRRTLGEMRNYEWWIGKIAIEAGGLMGYEMKDWPKHVGISQEKFLKIRNVASMRLKPSKQVN